MSDEAPPREGTEFGAYHLLEKIGSGGMADVYRAERRGVSGFVKTVAIKRMLPHLASNEHFVKMFIDEARIAASLDHSNIVSIHDFGQIDGQLFIVMELVEGWNVAQILKQLRTEQRLLPLRHALFIVLELCKGLQAAHARTVGGRPAPVIHRDVSPQNVLVSTVGEVKIVDFGVAKTAVRLSETQVNSIKGKLAYMAPEQASGAEVDPRADVFSTGIVLHELLTCHRLFTGKHEAEMLLKVLSEPIAPPSKTRSKLPPEVDAIVMKALDRDLSRRYRTIAELGRDISAFLLSTRLEAGPVELSDFLRGVFPAQFAAIAPAPPAPHIAGDGIALTRIVANEIGQLGADLEVPGLVRPNPGDTPATIPGHTQTQLVRLVKDLAGEVATLDDVSLWVQVALLARLGLISSKATEKRDRVINALANAARGATTAGPELP